MSLLLPLSQLFASGIQIGLSDKEKNISNHQWGSLSCETQISLEITDGEKISTTNESVELTARVKNLSTNTYHLYVSRTVTHSVGFSFSVISPNGKDVSPPPFDPTGALLSGGLVIVRPNQINGFKFDLKDVCKLDELGTYKVVLKVISRVPGSHQLTNVVSNPLSITVRP